MSRSRTSTPMLPQTTSTPTYRQTASATLCKLWKLDFSRPSAPVPPIIRTSPSRLAASSEKTILYLAYGSNLSAETFKGNRGIRPLSAINVHVPSLDLTFDLAGVPYVEPCFANTRYHLEPLPTPPPYHKDRWTKGLIGVVYEVTPADYRTIIATEGGGASYLDVVVPCYALPEGSKTVIGTPTGDSFKAHTLLQPAEDEPTPRTSSNRVHRPDPSYAQPSARYLKLVTDGAEEHSLPDEYLAYLHRIRPYTITTAKQRVGQGLIAMFFAPILLALFALGRLFADGDGRIPEWLASLMGLVFKVLWAVYDGFMFKAFGDGERTMKEKYDGGEDGGRVRDEETGLRGTRVRAEKRVRLEGDERALR